MINVRPPPKPTLPADPPPGQALSVMPAAHVYWTEDYEYYDQIGRDPLQQARIWLIEDTDARVARLEEVLAAYPKQMHKRLMLDTIAERGDEAMVRCCVQSGMKLHPEVTDRPRSEEEEDAIQAAEENGDPLDVDDSAVVPIHRAALAKHMGCVKILVEEGRVPVDSRDTYGRTPLMISTDQPELVAYLLEKGADPTLRTNPDTCHEDFVGPLPDGDALEYAAARGNAEVLRMLLEHSIWGSGENGEPVPRISPRSIVRAASQPQGFEALKLLLERGGYPLEAAGGQTKIELLTDEQRETIQQATPDAITDGQLESIQLLLSYQFPSDLDGNILPFEVPDHLRKSFTWGAYEAAKTDMVAKFEFIQSSGVVEHDTMSLDKRPKDQNLNLQHLLDKAAEAGSVEIVRLLIEKYGADPNKHRSPPGLKPLYMAASNDKPQVVKMLLDRYGADIHLGTGKYATGPTALFGAIIFKSYESVELLLRHCGPVDYISEGIRTISAPATCVLLAHKEGTKAAVKLLSWEESEETRNQLDNWQNLNPRYVLLDIGPDDREWIGRLQARRPKEELRETGENARYLEEEEENVEGEAEEGEEGGDDDGDEEMNVDPKAVMKPRHTQLRSDPDLLPEFKPWLVPA
ncbi:hypothetical protein NLU13_3559 [Sarocladium strictum]|uniref:Ankyrin n=1 Tax=Sarocladium strictum TaxID=5046 RepID=A0AA39L9W4_SARSR|nr:hypothetical protein NLU13_3559 [Sarocladium strictum]